MEQLKKLQTTFSTIISKIKYLFSLVEKQKLNNKYAEVIDILLPMAKDYTFLMRTHKTKKNIERVEKLLGVKINWEIRD